MYLLYQMNYLLTAAAVFPALILLIKVYQEDRLEKEPLGLLILLVILGAISTAIAVIGERVGFNLLNSFVPHHSPLYPVIAYYIVVAVVEECSKYIVLKKATWHNREFNCQFDGVVYAVFVSLGFALWENIQYVYTYGLSTALLRAFTAVPGHACFGVFMGIFYGLSKRYELQGNLATSKSYRMFSLLVPILIHGTYDYLATTSKNDFIFIGFIIILFIIAYRTINRFSDEDRYM